MNWKVKNIVENDLKRLNEKSVRLKEIIFFLILAITPMQSFPQLIFPENFNRLEKIKFEFTEIEGIGYEASVSRRDPSDIIKVNDIFYVWYTKIDSLVNGIKTPLYPSGYYGSIWYAVSEDEGKTWEEVGQALGPGTKGSFDSHAVFTPNILADKGEYYLYYTGVRPTPGKPDGSFENNSTDDFTAVGIAISESPEGPFQRKNLEPVIKVSKEEKDFDSYRVDDAALVVREGTYFLYYKGRSVNYGTSGPKFTEMGVTVAEHPAGPFIKRAEPVLSKSHEVLVWNRNGGIASLASISRTINWAPDGIDFSPLYENLQDIPAAPGLYRPHLENGHNVKSIPGWGISQKNMEGSVYLIRFTMTEINNQ